MTKLSIILPTLNAAPELAACLRAITASEPAGVEIVVSDGGSSDGTPGQARAAGATFVTGPQGRGGQLHRGAEAAGGDWLLFLHADSRLPRHWHAIVQHHITNDPTRAAAFRLGFRAAGFAPRLVAGWANLRSLLGLPYGDQGLLISASHYAAIGGYADIPLMEDVEIAARLKGRLRLLPAIVTTGAGRYQRQGWLRRGARNLILVCRYKLGADPHRLARAYGASDPPAEN